MKLTKTMLESMSTKDLQKLDKMYTERMFLIHRLSQIEWPTDPRNQMGVIN